MNWGRMHESISAQASRMFSPECEGDIVHVGGDGRCAEKRRYDDESQLGE